MKQRQSAAVFGTSGLEEEDGWCPSCRPGPQQEMCGEASQGFFCTRDRGHALPHVACGGRKTKLHNYYSWPRGQEIARQEGRL